MSIISSSAGKQGRLDFVFRRNNQSKLTVELSGKGPVVVGHPSVLEVIVVVEDVALVQHASRPQIGVN